MGVCCPNLVTTELSTTNVDHNYSPFRLINGNFDYNNYFISHCFIDFKYEDYHFIWFIFIEFCYNQYKQNNKKLTFVDYFMLIEKFVAEYESKKEIIHKVLATNDISFEHMNKMFEILDEEKMESSL